MRSLDATSHEHRDAETEERYVEHDVGELYERHHREVFRLALRYGRGRVSWAEDITQEVFMKLLRVRERLRDIDSLDGWLYRVTTRHCLNKLRHEALVRSTPLRWLLGEPPTPATPENVVLANDELESVANAVAALPAKERVAFYMKYIDDQSQTEIASVLGHSTGYVSKLLQRARERLLTAGWEIPNDD